MRNSYRHRPRPKIDIVHFLDMNFGSMYKGPKSKMKGKTIMAMDGAAQIIASEARIGAMRRAHEEVRAEIDAHIKTATDLRAWQSYAATLRGSLDAERMVEADIMSELRRLDPTNPLADPDHVLNLGAHYYKSIGDQATAQRAVEGVKKYYDKEKERS